MIHVTDPLEVDTADKLVIVALGDGSVRGINLGSKKEVKNLESSIYSQILTFNLKIFATPATDVALTAVTYEEETGTVFTGNANGLVQVFSIKKSLQEPHVVWKRNGHAITSLVTKLSSNGDTVLCISAGKIKFLGEYKIYS